MPKGNIIGNRKANYKKKLSNFETINAKVDSGLAGLIGNSARRFKKVHEQHKKNNIFRITSAILIYCHHKHNNKTILEITKMFHMKTDEIRRILHTTKKMFSNWKDD